MPTIITLRTNKENNHFRQHIENLMRIEGITELIICSGYFKVNSATTSVLANMLKTHCPNVHVKLVGAMPDGDKTFKSLSDFRDELRKHNINASANKVVSEGSWHAKIAIAICNGNPVAAILGSSNMTVPAFGIEGWIKYWNNESDVLITSDENIYNAIARTLSETEELFMALRLDENILQPSEADQLRRIYDLIQSLILENM